MSQIIDLTADTPPRRYQTRSSTRSQAPPPPAPPPTLLSTPQQPSPSSQPTADFSICPLPWTLRNPPTASLRSPLLRKRAWLQSHTVSLPPSFSPSPLSSTPSSPIEATLIFAHSSAGTATCISPSGVLLTCAHCIAETPSALDPSTSHVLLFSSGAVVTARLLAWDPVRDLALLVIAESEPNALPARPFPYIPLASTPPKRNARLLCIGHPGSEDLETPRSNVATGYDVLVVSEGKFRGIAKGADVQDNSEIGALQHTCWTYWGHSGAPLVDAGGGGDLVGVHSSWDDETGMRRGVAWEAVDAFLREFEGRGEGGVPEGWRWCVRREK